MKRIGGHRFCLMLLAAVVAACSCGRSPSDATAAKLSPQDVRVQVARVGYDDESGSDYVLLRDDKESRSLPIMIGDSEATAILFALHGIKPERPMTHDLMHSIIAQTGNKVDRVVIGDMRDEVYYAKIYMDGGRYTIDSRPSDAIALATGMNAPIYVNTKLFESAPAIGQSGKIPDVAKALGMTVEPLTPELAAAFGEPDTQGLLVSGLDSTATKAGLERGDVIERVDNHEVKALDDFSEQIANAKSESVTLTIKRNGSSYTVTMAVDGAR